MARKAVPGFAIVNDDIYEGSESFVMTIEFAPGLSADLVQFANPDGTTCIGFSCVPEYEVTITDEGDLPALSLSVDPSSIAEEDDDGTTSVAENVSTVTVGITNGKTFAVDQTATLTFSGTATQGTHYSVSPGDADTNTAGHQVVLPKETASVEVTVTATGNDTDDGPRTVTVAADLDGTAIGSRGITILDDDTTTPTTVPGAPTSLTATASGTTTIDLSWTAPADNGGSAITGYRIEVSPNGTSSWTNRVADTGNTSTTYAHTGLSAGTTRHYRVSAINSVGTGAASNVDDATTEDASATTVPGAPTSLTATASGTTTINLSWTAPANDGGSAITGYRIEVSPNGTSSWTNRVADTGTTTTTYSHTGLSAGTTRHYRVSAINSVGTGAASNVDDATTDAAATTVPGAPTSLTATASGTTTIDLDWTAPADDGGSAITGYRIEVSLQRQLELDRPRRRHRQHQHHLLPHRPFRRHHPPLPRLGDQLGRHRRRLQRRQRHHRRRRHHRARRPDQPHGNGQRAHPDRPRLGPRRPTTAAPPSPATGSRFRPMAPRAGPTASPTPAPPTPPTPTPAFPPAPPATTASRPSTRSAPAPPPARRQRHHRHHHRPGAAGADR